MRTENRNEDQDHDHPFAGTKHLNPIGVNEDPVVMSRRTTADFPRPDKLQNEVPKPKPTGNEKFLGWERGKSKGRFASDPDRQRVVKDPGQQ